MAKLGINIDHIATVREARGALLPDPIYGAFICEKTGCDSIVCHLREDRRHIKERDVVILKKILKTRLNLEMSIAPDIVNFACRIRPDQATLVPEKRKELTTEGGLNVRGNEARIKKAVAKLAENGIEVSLFINPVKSQIDASARAGAGIIELHTGEYANARSRSASRKKLGDLKEAARYALKKGLEVNAGHGLNYNNARAVARIKGINELNIGHSIIAQSLFSGLGKAVKDMLRLIR